MTADASAARPWWQDALIYQVYVRSFADSTGDGIGDLTGIRSHLEHIASLGVQALWLNPCYPSPQRDAGYDVADYFDIEPEYGTLDTFDALLADAAELDIRILMDLVPNHCSNEHAWFRAALDASPGSAERARFYFRDGKDGGSEPPNNWQAAFGGSAWTRINDDPADGQWYLATFSPYQPDFDHTNADVQRHFAEILTFWLDRGVSGFRVDAVNPVGKDPDLPDQPPVGPDVDVLDITWMNPYTVFRPEGHVVWRHFRAVIDGYAAAHPDRELALVAETYAVRRPELVREFTQPDQFHQTFSFDLMLSPWEKGSLERALNDPLHILDDIGVAPAWTLNNHDIQRIVTRLGRADADDPDTWTNNNLAMSVEPVDLAVGTRRAKAMAALIFALPGSLYLYQGEELGLPEVLDIPDGRRQDPIFALTNGEKTGRDGCRVPLPWTTDATTSFGFSTARPDGSVDEPWLPQPDDWGTHSVEMAEEDDTSMLAVYRELAVVRADHATVQPLHATCIEFGAGLVAIRRGDLIVVVNVTSGPVAIDLQHPELTGTEPVFSTQPDEMHTPGVIPADATVWFIS